MSWSEVAAAIAASDASLCITLLANAGCSEREIASISGHTPAYISQILKRYVATDTRVAVSAGDLLWGHVEQ